MKRREKVLRLTNTSTKNMAAFQLLIVTSS